MSALRPTGMRWLFGGQEEERSVSAVPRPDQQEERRLIERAQGGDHDAFAALLEKHRRRVFSVITNLLRRPAEVEDIAQQVFLKVYLALPRFDFRSSFSTWLHRIVVNECYDQMRRRRAQKAAAGSEVAVGDPQELERLMGAGGKADFAKHAREAELRGLVEGLFRHLPAEDRLLLTLREMEGFSVDEIAAVTKIKPNTVKVRLFRARKRLLEVRRRFFPTARGD
jgi:RNA polymerase sigma-70 factor (ECF subfamily)